MQKQSMTIYQIGLKIIFTIYIGPVSHNTVNFTSIQFIFDTQKYMDIYVSKMYKKNLFLYVNNLFSK